MIPQTLAHYRIVEKLGEGGMGVVYRAHDDRLRRYVALKVLRDDALTDPTARARLLREARAASALNHPNICTVHEVGESDGECFIAMEWVDGRPLSRLIPRGGLPAESVLRCGIQIADALQHAHDHGVIHRDLKPSNILLAPDGRAKVLDFGLAKRVPTQGAQTTSSIQPTLTEPGAVVGTLRYMAPELFRGATADVRSDIWAIGVIVHEMLAGEPPFHGETGFELSAAILNHAPSPLPADTAPALQSAVRCCLAKDPSQRYQRAAEVRAVLESIAAVTEMAARTGDTGQRARWSRAWLIPAVVALAAVLGAAAILVPKFASPRQPSFRRLSFRRGTLESARFAPDGHTVVYCAAWDGGPTRLYTTHDQGHESSALELPVARLLSISASSEAAILVDPHVSPGNALGAVGMLARVPLSGGAPRKVLEDVVEADWVQDGRQLAVVRAVGGRCRLEYPPGHVLYDTPGSVSDIRVSPKGNSIAFMDHPIVTDTRGSIALTDLAGHRRTLSSGWGDEGGLAWSKNGNEVWFTAVGAGSARAVWAVSLSGRLRLVERVPGGITLLDVGRDGRVLLKRGDLEFSVVGRSFESPAERRLSWLDWSQPTDLSADGKQLVFTEFGEGAGRGYAACLRGTDGSPVTRLGDGYATAISADGQWVASILQTSPRQLALLPTGPGEPRLLPHGPILDYEFAAFCPDGKGIVFSGYERGRGIRCYIQDLRSGTIRAVTPEGFRLFYPGATVSPDGRFVIATDFKNGAELFPVGGGPARKIAGLSGAEVAAGWNEDGRSLYTYTMSTLPQRIYRFDLGSGSKQQWWELVPSDPAGILSVAGIRITPDGRTCVYSYIRDLADLYLAEGLR